MTITITHEQASLIKNLLNKDAETYMQLQLKKLSENTINNEVANRLLEHKQNANQAFNN